jgi:hypothetical protein
MDPLWKQVSFLYLEPCRSIHLHELKKKQQMCCHTILFEPASRETLETKKVLLNEERCKHEREGCEQLDEDVE